MISFLRVLVREGGERDLSSSLPDTDLFKAYTGLMGGAVVNKETFKVGIELCMISGFRDGEWWTALMVFERVHEGDQDTILGDEFSHALAPGRSKLWWNCAEEGVVINELEATLRDVKLEKVVNKEMDLGIGDVLSLLQFLALFHGNRTNVEPIDLSILVAQVEHIHATTATGHKNVSCCRDLIFDRLLFNHLHQSRTGGRLVPRVDTLFPELVPAIWLLDNVL